MMRRESDKVRAFAPCGLYSLGCDNTEPLGSFVLGEDDSVPAAGISCNSDRLVL